MKSRSEFLLGMMPYRGLFDSPDDLKAYYGLYRGSVLSAATPFIRAVFRKIGYGNLMPSLRPDVHKRLTDAGQRPVDYEKLCMLLPSDYVLSFTDGFFGTRLEGLFVITDLLEVDSWDRLFIVGRKSIFHQMLINYVVSSNEDYEGENVGLKKMHQFYMDNRLSDDHSTMAKCFVVREFLKACGSFPADMKSVYEDATSLDLERRLTVLVVAYRLTFVDNSLLCDNSFNEIKHPLHYKQFFDQFLAVDPPIMPEFIAAYRLDE